MKEYFCDFHIHIGEALGKPVKIAAGRTLTLKNALFHARYVKGLDVITLIDGVCDHVLTEVTQAVLAGELCPAEGGGYLYGDGLLVLLGAEVELTGNKRGAAAHFGCWFGDLEQASDFNQWLKTVQTNTTLSSQRARTDVEQLALETHVRNGVFVVHHAFTPFKGLLGACVDRLSDYFPDVSVVDALELGLSSDTFMADRVSELESITFLSNSDAHGLNNIAREYNVLQMESPSFEEVRFALHHLSGRGVVLNCGLHPQHGKYFRTRCRKCDEIITSTHPMCSCTNAKGHVNGVFDRLIDIADRNTPVHPTHRPLYRHRIPLRDIPGLGPSAYEKLIHAYHSELALEREASEEELIHIVGPKLASAIVKALSGQGNWVEGGAGTYGKFVL